MTVKVKICGIRTLHAADAAITSGADYLGFNFVPESRRFVELRVAAEIIKKIKGRIELVGVFQNEEVDIVRKIAEKLNLDYVQLHGQEDLEYIKKVQSPIIKAVYSANELELNPVDYFLLDRPTQGKGEMVDLDEASLVSQNFPIFLAGGLTPQNVESAMRKVKPYAVDVAGGIETDGIEDIHKIRAFIENAKGASL